MVLWNKDTLINISLKTQEKKALHGNIVEFFLLHTPKTTFWMENLTQRWTKSGYFFPKSMYFFYFHKRAVEITSSPLVARLRAWLNIHQYPWISPNILENAWMSVFYVRVLNMPDYFTCLTVFWMWHGSICKGYTDLRNMSKLNMPQYTLMSLSMPEHG